MLDISYFQNPELNISLSLPLSLRSQISVWNNRFPISVRLQWSVNNVSATKRRQRSRKVPDGPWPAQPWSCEPQTFYLNFPGR